MRLARIGQHADGEERGGLGHRERAVEVAVDLGAGSSEVDAHLLALDRHRDPQGEILGAVGGDERVLGLEGPVGERRYRRLPAAFSVIENCCHTHPQLRRRLARDESLVDACGGEQVRGALSAQVGESLRRVAHLRDQIADLGVAPLPEEAGRDHDPLLRQRS